MLKVFREHPLKGRVHTSVMMHNLIETGYILHLENIAHFIHWNIYDIQHTL